MFSKLWGYLAAFGGVVLALLAALGAAKRSGKKEAQLEQTEKSLKQAKEANEIDTDVRNLSDAELNKRLSKYVRK